MSFIFVSAMSGSAFKDWLEAAVAAATLGGIVWKVVLPAAKHILGREVRYAAQIAELKPAPDQGYVWLLEQFLPFPKIPSYSELSSYSPTFPPQAGHDRQNGISQLREYMSGPAMQQAINWQNTARPQIFLGRELTGELRLFVQTIARLRWYLIEKCGGDLVKVAEDIGTECATALSAIELLRAEMVRGLPTRVLVIRIKNCSNHDVTDLKVDIGCGGEIYDVVVNNQLSDGKVDRKENRFMVSWPVMQPGFVVDITLWFRWESVFGSRWVNQCPLYPGYDGIIINHIGISNGTTKRFPSLLKDLEAWKSMDIPIGKRIKKVE